MGMPHAAFFVPRIFVCLRAVYPVRLRCYNPRLYKDLCRTLPWPGEDIYTPRRDCTAFDLFRAIYLLDIVRTYGEFTPFYFRVCFRGASR